LVQWPRGSLRSNMRHDMNLWIGNIAPEVTDEELAEFVVKYGCPRPERIERVPGDGSRPAAVLAFGAGDGKMISQAQLRLNGMYWKGRQLLVQTILQR
jgi:RNA recognition motif-containing protein